MPSVVPETVNLMNFIPVIMLCCMAQVTFGGDYRHGPDLITHVFQEQKVCQAGPGKGSWRDAALLASLSSL